MCANTDGRIAAGARRLDFREPLPEFSLIARAWGLRYSFPRLAQHFFGLHSAIGTISAPLGQNPIDALFCVLGGGSADACRACEAAANSRPARTLVDDLPARVDWYAGWRQTPQSFCARAPVRWSATTSPCSQWYAVRHISATFGISGAALPEGTG